MFGLGNLRNLIRTIPTKCLTTFCPRVLSNHAQLPNPQLKSTPSELQNNNLIDLVKENTRANAGRLYGVVQLCGKQFKVTSGDILIVEGYMAPTISDELRLDKVLLVGSRDFTLIGRPLLSPELINITATVIEKTLAFTKTHFKKKRRKQYLRINFQRSHHTMIRINSINIKC